MTTKKTTTPKARKQAVNKAVAIGKQWPMLKRANKANTGKAAPSATMLQALPSYGYRQGANNAFAIAMYMNGGATQAQVTSVCGGPNINVWRNIKATGKTPNGTVMVATQTKSGKQTVYHLALPAKRKQAVKKPVAKTA